MNLLQIKNNLLQAFEKNQQLDGLQKVKLEEQKLALMLRFKKIVTFETSIEGARPIQKQTKPTSFLMFRKLFYFFSLSLGITQDAAGNFMFAYSLLSLMNFLPAPILFVGTIIIVLLNSILFYAFQASLFKSALGIPNHNKEHQSLISTYIKQIELLNAINHQLFDIHFINKTSRATYKEYAEIALLLNQDIMAKQEKIGRFQETSFRKTSRWLVTAVGAVTTSAASYFFSTSILTMLSPSLLISPIGVLIVGLMIGASLSFYFSMQGKGLMSFFNPEYFDFKLLTNRLKRFDVKAECDFKRIYTLQTKLQYSHFEDYQYCRTVVEEPMYAFFDKKENKRNVDPLDASEKIITNPLY